MRSKMTAAVALATALVLAWQHFTTGVASHHLLAQEYLPSLSNWWGLAILPGLTWVGLGSLERRLARAPHDLPAKDFIGAFLFGLALAAFYQLERQDLCEYLLQCLLLLALFYPVYRMLCLMGFVFGMAFAFGPVDPLLTGLALAALSGVLYHALRLVSSTIGAIFR